MSFLLEFEKQFRDEGFGARNWGGRRKNIIEIETSPKNILLYVKESNLKSGFWGLNQNQLNIIQKADLPWFVVLLTGSIYTGYILPSKNVIKAVKNGDWSFSKTDYKIHDHEINSLYQFLSFDKLLSFLF